MPVEIVQWQKNGTVNLSIKENQFQNLKQEMKVELESS